MVCPPLPHEALDADDSQQLYGAVSIRATVGPCGGKPIIDLHETEERFSEIGWIQARLSRPSGWCVVRVSPHGPGEPSDAVAAGARAACGGGGPHRSRASAR